MTKLFKHIIIKIESGGLPIRFLSGQVARKENKMEIVCSAHYYPADLTKTGFYYVPEIRIEVSGRDDPHKCLGLKDNAQVCVQSAPDHPNLVGTQGRWGDVRRELSLSYWNMPRGKDPDDVLIKISGGDEVWDKREVSDPLTNTLQRLIESRDDTDVLFQEVEQLRARIGMRNKQIAAMRKQMKAPAKGRRS